MDSMVAVNVFRFCVVVLLFVPDGLSSGYGIVIPLTGWVCRDKCGTACSVLWANDRGDQKQRSGVQVENNRTRSVVGNMEQRREGRPRSVKEPSGESEDSR